MGARKCARALGMERWVEEREWAVGTEDLYNLDEITVPRVREWRAERVRAIEARTIVAKASTPSPRRSVSAGTSGLPWRLRPDAARELAGLRRRDVDLGNLLIRVRVAEPERTNGKRAPGPTKSDAGARAVVLPAFLQKEVEQHLAWFAERDLTAWSSSARRVPPSGVGREHALARSSAFRTASASTTFVTPDTRCDEKPTGS